MTQLNDEVREVAPLILQDLELAVQQSPASGEMLFAYVTGSHLYGLENEDSDVDVRGVHLAETEGLFRMSPLFGSRDTTSTVTMDGADAQSTELGKFCHLACQGNPQVLEALYVPDWAVLQTTSVFRAFVRNRDAFVSQNVVNAYLGYTWSNLSQAVNHVFRAVEQGNPKLAQELLDVHGWQTMDGLLSGTDGFGKLDLLDVCDVTWADASETRATKAAGHVLRLLVCVEKFMWTREFSTDLGPDLPLVRGVRFGEVPLSEFRHQVLERRDRILRLVDDHGLSEVLPEHPDRERVDEMLVQVRRGGLR